MIPNYLKSGNGIEDGYHLLMHLEHQSSSSKKLLSSQHGNHTSAASQAGSAELAVESEAIADAGPVLEDAPLTAIAGETN